MQRMVKGINHFRSRSEDEGARKAFGARQICLHISPGTTSSIIDDSPGPLHINDGQPQICVSLVKLIMIQHRLQMTS